MLGASWRDAAHYAPRESIWRNLERSPAGSEVSWRALLRPAMEAIRAYAKSLSAELIRDYLWHPEYAHIHHLPRSNRVGKIPQCYGSATCNGRKSRPLSKRAPPIPSAGASRRGSRFTGLAPRLLPVGHGRKPGLTPKRLATDYRRALAGDAALHLAGGGSSHPAAQTQVQAAAATTVPDQNSSP